MIPVSTAGVRLIGLSKRFGATTVLSNVSLEVGRGELLFLLGPSGAGKTTLLRIIGGYERPSEGAVEVAGRDITQLPPHRRNIGMVFQNYALFPHLTVVENLAFGLRMRRVPRGEIAHRVEEALDLVELAGLGGRFPRQLSGGQQQRVALARAIVYRPSVLLLDEPLANLDRRLRDAMRVELRRIQRRVGITTIMVTHDQEESLALADRVAVINAGCIEQVGTPASIYNRPVSPFVAGFIGEMNVLQGRVLEGRGSVPRIDCGGLELAVRADGFGAGDTVTVCARAEHFTLNGVSEGQPGMDATVELVTYLGASTLYFVRLEGGPVIKVMLTNAGGRILCAPGDRVRVGWPLEQSLCFANNG